MLLRLRAVLLLAAGVVVRAEVVRVDSAGCALSTGCWAAADVFERPYGAAHDRCGSAHGAAKLWK